MNTGWEFADALLYLIMLALVVESVFFAQLWLRSGRDIPDECRLDPGAASFRDLEEICRDLQLRLTRQPLKLGGDQAKPDA